MLKCGIMSHLNREFEEIKYHKEVNKKIEEILRLMAKLLPLTDKKTEISNFLYLCLNKLGERDLSDYLQVHIIESLSLLLQVSFEQNKIENIYYSVMDDLNLIVSSLSNLVVVSQNSLVLFASFNLITFVHQLLEKKNLVYQNKTSFSFKFLVSLRNSTQFIQKLHEIIHKQNLFPPERVPGQAKEKATQLLNLIPKQVCKWVIMGKGIKNLFFLFFY